MQFADILWEGLRMAELYWSSKTPTGDDHKCGRSDRGMRWASGDLKEIQQYIPDRYTNQ